MFILFASYPCIPLTGILPLYLLKSSDVYIIQPVSAINKKSYSGLGGNEREAHQRNIDMANEIRKTIPEGAKISDARNTGGIGPEQLGELYNINNKIDATDLIVFYQPPNPDPSVEVPSIKELEKKLNKKLKDMTPEDLAERDKLLGHRSRHNYSQRIWWIYRKHQSRRI